MDNDLAAVLRSTYQKKAKAFEMYLEERPQKAIADTIGLPVATIKTWIKREDWKNKRASVNEALLRGLRERYELLVTNARFEVLQRHLDMSKKIEKQIMSLLFHEDGSPKEVTEYGMYRLSQAMKNMTDVSARAVGLDRDPGFKGKANIAGVTLNLNLNPKPADEPKQIDVEVTDHGSNEF